MIENIFETVIMGSNKVFLNMPEDDYFFSYDFLNIESAKDLVETYFRLRGRDGIPHVVDIEHDAPTHRVKITLEVDEHESCDMEGYKVPDSLNINRHDDDRDFE